MKKRRPQDRRRLLGTRSAGPTANRLLPAPGTADMGKLPYDDGLLDQCRRKWRQGDWAALASLTAEQLESHPERARIAVMVASAHQALGEFTQTRHLVHLARQWGCDEHLMTRVLVAGVHNTLGRAAAAGGRLRDQAVAHFRDALAPAGIGGMSLMVVQDRIQSELGAMALQGQTQRWLLGGQAVQPLALGTGRAVAKTDEKLTERAVERATQAQFAKMGQVLEKTVQREVGNAVKQIEAYANLQGYLASGELLPSLHGWPVSPDFALLVVQMLEQQPFDAVVEFGSGSSTLLVARTLTHVAVKRPQQRRPLQVAFEHLDQYHRATADLLQAAGLREQVDLVLAPLKPLRAQAGDSFNYYDTGEALQRLAARLSDVPAPRILAIVDGPPEVTGPLARYPALEVLLQAVPVQHGHVLLDDYRRPGEQATAQRWQEFLSGRGVTPQVTEYALEKQACLLRFDTTTSIPSTGA
jgi:predicted O-methyltransferase YrrM